MRVMIWFDSHCNEQRTLISPLEVQSSWYRFMQMPLGYDQLPIKGSQNARCPPPSCAQLQEFIS